MFKIIRSWFSQSQVEEQEEIVVSVQQSNFDTDRDEFTPEECNRIRSAFFPETMRENLRMEKKMIERKAWLASLRSDSDTESFLGTGGGGSSSDC